MGVMKDGNLDNRKCLKKPARALYKFVCKYMLSEMGHKMKNGTVTEITDEIEAKYLTKLRDLLRCSLIFEDAKSLQAGIDHIVENYSVATQNKSFRIFSIK